MIFSIEELQVLADCISASSPKPNVVIGSHQNDSLTLLRETLGKPVSHNPVLHHLFAITDKCVDVLVDDVQVFI